MEGEDEQEKEEEREQEKEEDEAGVHVLCANGGSLVSQELRGDLNSQSLVTTLGLRGTRPERGERLQIGGFISGERKGNRWVKFILTGLFVTCVHCAICISSSLIWIKKEGETKKKWDYVF